MRNRRIDRLTYRISLAGMIFLRRDDQQRLRRAEEPGLSPTDSLFDYFLVSTHLSFFDYFNEYFYPYFQKRRPGLTSRRSSSPRASGASRGT
jgi:hypothetical protein